MTTNPLVSRSSTRFGGRTPMVFAAAASALALTLFISGRGSWRIALLLLAVGAVGFVPVDGVAMATWPQIVQRFVTRGRWTGVRVEEREDCVAVTFRGRVEQRWAKATFHGRLDLAGSDESQWREFEALLRRCAVRGEPTHVVLHELTHDGVTSAWLCANQPVRWPTLWRPSTVPAPLVLDSPWYFEAWGYVRTKNRYIATLRISGDTAAEGHLFARLAPVGTSWRMATHLEVQPRVKALRRVRRASHASRSDHQFSRTLGFVGHAQRDADHREVLTREQLVVGGDALVRVAVLLTCEADTRESLAHQVRLATDHLRSVGARIERGYGRQLEWCAFQQMVTL